MLYDSFGSPLQLGVELVCIVYCAIIVLLQSLRCKMILFQFAHGKMITQPTLKPPQTRDWCVPLFAQKSCHEDAT